MRSMALLFAACFGLMGCAALPRSGAEHPELDRYVGIYRGSFESGLTEDPADDLNYNPCTPTSEEPCSVHQRPLVDILMALRRESGGEVSLAFYRDRAALHADEPVDLLGAGCGTRLGAATAVEAVEGGARGDVTAVFPLTSRNRQCLGKLRPVSRHHLRLELLGASARAAATERSARVIIDKSVRDTNYLYVKEDGVQRRVRIDLDNTFEEDHTTRYRVCIENDLGEFERCVLTDREFRSFVLPVPVPGGMGVNYTWWQELRPRLHRTEGRYALEQYVGRFEPVPGQP